MISVLVLCFVYVEKSFQALISDQITKKMALQLLYVWKVYLGEVGRR